MRAFVRETQDEIERIDPARAWPEVGQRIQAETAANVRAAFLEATDGAAAIQALIAGHLADEALGLDGVGIPVSFDVSTLWQGGPTFEGRAKSGLMASLGIVGGASVGVEMLGMLGTLLGAAVVGPAALGVAAVFGGKQVLSERRRQLADRRQQARAFLAEFVEEVRFETDGRLASLLDDVQRQMRARFADRIRELRRTFAETAAGLESAMAAAESAPAARLAELARDLDEIDHLRTRAASRRQRLRLSDRDASRSAPIRLESARVPLLESAPRYREMGVTRGTVNGYVGASIPFDHRLSVGASLVMVGQRPRGEHLDRPSHRSHQPPMTPPVRKSPSEARED